MKRISITITLDCRDDTPPHVIDWMADNLLEHAQHEFGCDYGDFGEEIAPDFEGPPLAEDGDSTSTIVVRPIGS